MVVEETVSLVLLVVVVVPMRDVTADAAAPELDDDDVR